MEANAEVKSETIVKGTPKTSSRDLEARENTQREYLETDSWLTIPKSLEDTFKEQGFTHITNDDDSVDIHGNGEAKFEDPIDNEIQYAIDGIEYASSLGDYYDSPPFRY